MQESPLCRLTAEIAVKFVFDVLEKAEAPLLTLLKLGGARKRKPPHRPSSILHPGTKIRVALAMRPDVMLFDEITSALDPQLVGEVLDVLLQLKAEGMTMVLATHEMEFARQAADKVCFLKDGRIIEDGPPSEIFVSPKENATKQFLARALK